MPGPIAPVRLALAQLNARVGDLEGNAAKAREAIIRARDEGAEVVLLPELVISGCPPEDLLLRERFLLECEEAVRHAAGAAEGVVALVGFPERGDDVFNALAVCADGMVQAVYRKAVLGGHGASGQERHFQPGAGAAILELGDARLGLTIGEDLWSPGPPGVMAALAGAQLLLNAAASAYHRGGGRRRELMLAQRARDSLAAVACCNLVGGQDDLVFDGQSVVLDHEGEVIARAPQFKEAIVHAAVDCQAAATARLRDARLRPPVASRLPKVERAGAFRRADHQRPVFLAQEVAPLLDELSEVHQALVLATRDFVVKNGFAHACLGLSGDRGSTLAALIAVDALGPRNVTGVLLPSPSTPAERLADARRLAAHLDMERLDVPIGPALDAFARLLEPLDGAGDAAADPADLEARLRAQVLTALADRRGWLVLATADKSELSVGGVRRPEHAAGGFAVLRDVLATLVHELLRHRDDQAAGALVPAAVLQRSGRLRQPHPAGLPDAETLDAILERAIEHDASRSQLVAAGLPDLGVDRVLERVDRNELARRQAPPGPRITLRAYGRDRRVPITNAYR